jgi:hypothetical protein
MGVSSLDSSSKVPTFAPSPSYTKEPSLTTVYTPRSLDWRKILEEGIGLDFVPIQPSDFPSIVTTNPLPSTLLDYIDPSPSWSTFTNVKEGVSSSPIPTTIVVDSVTFSTILFRPSKRLIRHYLIWILLTKEMITA